MEASFLSTLGNTFTLTIDGYRIGETVEFAKPPCTIILKPVNGVFKYFPAYLAKELEFSLVAPDPAYFDGLITTTANGFDITLDRGGTTVFTGKTNGYNTSIEVRKGQIICKFKAYDIINEVANGLPFTSLNSSRTVRALSDNLIAGPWDAWENEFYSSSGLRYEEGILAVSRLQQKEFWSYMNESFLVSFYNRGDQTIRGFVHDYSGYTVTRELQPVISTPKRKYQPAVGTIIVDYQQTAKPYFIAEDTVNLGGAKTGETIDSIRLLPTTTDLSLVINNGTVRRIDTITTTPTGFYDNTGTLTVTWTLKATSSPTAIVRYWNEGTAAWQAGLIGNTYTRSSSLDFTENVSDTITGIGTAFSGEDYIALEFDIAISSEFLNDNLEDTLAVVVGTRDTYLDDFRATLSFPDIEFNGVRQIGRDIVDSNGAALKGLDRVVSNFVVRNNPIYRGNYDRNSTYRRVVNTDDNYSFDLLYSVRLDVYRPYIAYSYFTYNLDGTSSDQYTKVSEKAIDFIERQLQNPVMEVSGEFRCDDDIYTQPFDPFNFYYSESDVIIINPINAKIDCYNEVISGNFVERKQS